MSVCFIVLGQGSFAQALLEEDGGIQDAAPASSLGGLFAEDAPAGPAAPSFGEVHKLLITVRVLACFDGDVCLFADFIIFGVNIDDSHA